MVLNSNLCGYEFKNPIIPASGTFGYGYEFSSIYDINILGSFSIKGTTGEMRFGNQTPRIADAHSGMLNAIGLQNPGIDNVISDEFIKLKKVYDGHVIANVGGSTIGEYVDVASKFAKSEMVSLIELNVSCPNVKCGGIHFGSDPELLTELILEVKKVIGSKPLFVKLSPNVTDIVLMARACEAAGVDGLVLINTLVGMRLNLHTKKPVLSNGVGGLSGPCIFPVAIKNIYQVYSAVNIPIIGIGGVTSAYDVIEMMMAGASLVQVGTQNLMDPFACKKIIEDLPKVMKELGIENINDIIGASHES